jgi:UDP-N-acetylglucosamine acyltransferase
MVGGGSLVRKDVPPYVMAAREPLSYTGINRVGLHRAKFTRDETHHIEDIYRILFVRGLSVRKALSVIEEEVEPSKYRDEIVDFVKGASRGLMKGFRSLNAAGRIAEPAL